MSLPPVAVLFQPSTCFPAWHLAYKKYGGRLSNVVKSGCATVDGNVQCDPAAMAKAASAKLGTNVTLEVYTLARYLASEVGSGTVEEKVAVAQAAVNRAVYVERLPQGILSLLLYRQKSGPNRGHYGPIHMDGPTCDAHGIPRDSGGKHCSPYNRWAATSRDPTVGDILVAQALVEGVFDGFNKGADDQNGPDGLKDPVGKVVSESRSRNYWVGPLPGVNPWHTFLYRHCPDIAPNSPEGQALIARGVQAMKSGKPSWLLTPICNESTGQRLVRLAPAGAAFAGVGLLGFLLVGLIGRHRQLLGGRPDDWWKHGVSPQRDRGRLCYRTKTSALQAFRDANRQTIDAWGGLDVSASPSEFDAVNHKYGLKGRRAVRTLSKAIWAAAPSRPPYCLDQIDLEALNATSPGQKGRGFILPDWAYNAGAQTEEERYHQGQFLKQRTAKIQDDMDRAIDAAFARRGMEIPDVPF